MIVKEGGGWDGCPIIIITIITIITIILIMIVKEGGGWNGWPRLAAELDRNCRL